MRGVCAQKARLFGVSSAEDVATQTETHWSGIALQQHAALLLKRAAMRRGGISLPL